MRRSSEKERALDSSLMMNPGLLSRAPVVDPGSIPRPPLLPLAAKHQQKALDDFFTSPLFLRSHYYNERKRKNRERADEMEREPRVSKGERLVTSRSGSIPTGDHDRKSFFTSHPRRRKIEQQLSRAFSFPFSRARIRRNGLRPILVPSINNPPRESNHTGEK